MLEEFKNKVLPWEEIKGVSVKAQKVRNGMVANWLMIRTTDDTRHMTKATEKLNGLILGPGIPVANLTTYDVEPERIVGLINERISR